MALPTTLAMIERAEAELNQRLTTPHRNRLLRDNGGTVMADGDQWVLFSVWDDTDRKTMTRTASHIVRETTLARGQHGFPADAIALAEDGSGNYLILLKNGLDVAVWDHETTEYDIIDVRW